eukprot:588398-Karenia_brevis.AAC.1
MLRPDGHAGASTGTCIRQWRGHCAKCSVHGRKNWGFSGTKSYVRCVVAAIRRAEGLAYRPWMSTAQLTGRS